VKRPDKKQPRDPEWLVQLRLDVTELVDTHEISTWVGPDKHKPELADNPELAERRSGGFAWPAPDADAHHSPLLTQLQLLRSGFAAAGGRAGGRSAPGSRLPAGSDVADLAVDITTGATSLRWRLLRALGRQEESARFATRTIVTVGYTRPGAPPSMTCTRPAELEQAYRRHGRPDRLDAIDVRGRFLGYTAPPLAQTLRSIVDLTQRLDDDKLRATVCKRVHSWVLAARLTLSYSAPMLALKISCHYCGEQSLITRSDASSDVFCTTDGCVDDDGKQPRWPRTEWHLVLTHGETA
jgi:hypothetical protein